MVHFYNVCCFRSLKTSFESEGLVKPFTPISLYKALPSAKQISWGLHILSKVKDLTACVAGRGLIKLKIGNLEGSSFTRYCI